MRDVSKDVIETLLEEELTDHMLKHYLLKSKIGD
jgi:hypothetical protein